MLKYNYRLHCPRCTFYIPHSYGRLEEPEGRFLSLADYIISKTLIVAMQI